MKRYANLPEAIGIVVSSRLATLHELDTVYGAEDLYNLMEVLQIDAANRKIVSERDGQHR